MPDSSVPSTCKFDIDTEIISNMEVAQDHFLLYCNCPEIASSAQPGQFVHVLMTDESGLLLRRPFTIYGIHGSQISMLYQVIGEGTAALAQMGSGASIHVLGPLGKAFCIPSDIQAAILVGGGAGIASLMLLASELRNSGVRTVGLVGATNGERLLSVSDLQQIDVETHIATDDGSVGRHGFVTELLSDILERPQKNSLRSPTIYACGPHPMLRAVTEVTRLHHTPTQLAMENRMGCALGVCLGCVCKVRTDDGVEYQRVCTEGPVFNAEDIVW
ncbi:MAG: dihydroorotate dehydrogenase electron transfer subunit [Candidatus Poribacteria bacterium]|nr:dihydroorotate dehydrogenase electron transfer subunit [Candidatus Poribacteria bacterium]MDE0503236.1 dihydroorotate dehydrogenase electron transfer subunit [Candidatus Poribacteria bacterium]